MRPKLPQQKSRRLSSGFELPLLGLGTWNLREKECTKIVKSALEMGYTLVDTAHMYENQRAIASALTHFKREQFFLTSKFFLDQVDDDKIAQSIEKACDLALKELGVDYLDLYLMHWPDHHRPMVEMVAAMHALQKKGKIKSLGVSNFTVHHLKDVLKAGLAMQVNQVEFHPYLYQKELLDFCEKNKIMLQSYRPLGKGALIEETPFVLLGKKYRKTSAQIILRWLIQKGIPTVAKASSDKHLRENLALFDFALEEEDMRRIDSLNKDQRFCDTDWAEFNY